MDNSPRAKLSHGMSHNRHFVTFYRGASSSELKILEWMVTHGPHTIDYDVLRGRLEGSPFHYKYPNARKIVERIRKKGFIKEIKPGFFELTQKPIDHFYSDATRHVLDTVHHAVVGVGGGPDRVNGLQLLVNLGGAGQGLYERLVGAERTTRKLPVETV